MSSRSRIEGSRGVCPQDRELAVDQCHCLGDPRAVRGHVQPAACTRGMGERDRHRAVVLVARADALGDALDAEQPSRGEPADGDDQLRGEQAQLVVAPVLAEPLFLRRRRAVAPSRRRPAGIAARDRRAVERLVERRPRPARATAAASCRRARATAGALRPRRSPAPARTGTRAARRAARARATTRAGTRRRRRRGSSAGRAGATPASGRRRADGSSRTWFAQRTRFGVES